MLIYPLRPLSSPDATSAIIGNITLGVLRSTKPDTAVKYGSTWEHKITIEMTLGKHTDTQIVELRKGTLHEDAAHTSTIHHKSVMPYKTNRLHIVLHKKMWRASCSKEIQYGGPGTNQS